MLTRLSIRQFAIIPELDIDFQPGLSIITGETGAGKSILLGALSLALGRRAEAKSLPDGEEKCVVEVHFRLSDDTLKPLFDEEQVDFERHLICRREIYNSGRSRSFVNDTPVSLKWMQEMTSHVVELHHQHDNLALQTKEYQGKLLDTISGNDKLLNQYKSNYRDWSASRAQLEKLKELEINASRRKEFLSFQLNELHQSKLQHGEVSKLEEDQQVLEHADAIAQVLRATQHQLLEGQHAIITQLSSLLRQIHSVSSFYLPLASIQSRLETVRLELEDISLEAGRMDTPGGHDPGKLERIQSRLSLLYSMMKKYQAADEASLLGIQHTYENELNSLSTSAEQIQELEKQMQTQYERLISSAAQLHIGRIKGAKKLTPNVMKLLTELGMPNARFEIEIREESVPGPSGMDSIQFLFSANKGMSLLPIQSVASGGELSRLSLALKTLYAQTAELPTIIFDEIDTGISGEVAWRMGQMIRQMSGGHQILMITHSPQIAAQATIQFHVSKITSGSRDISSIQKLSSSDRVQEIAKMLSGDPPSKEAVSNASSLMKKAEKAD